MIYQFEHEEIKKCSDCPCWHPLNHPLNLHGFCHLDFEGRNRFDAVPADCPLVAISKTATTSSKTERVQRCEVCRTVGFPDYNFCPNCGRDLRKE